MRSWGRGLQLSVLWTGPRRGVEAPLPAADLTHQPLRCTTSSKERRFRRVPGLSGRSAG